MLEQDSGIKKAPTRIKALAKEYILPHIDFLTLSQRVVGKYWREATREQRQTMMAEFHEPPLRTYGVALPEYSDQHLEFLPLRAGEVSNPVTVDARFDQSGTPRSCCSIACGFVMEDGRFMRWLSRVSVL